MRKALYGSILILGFPIGIMCTLSLPLIWLGVVQPDPSPWNWLTVYIIDFFYGLALLAQLAGFMRGAVWNHTWTVAVAGYSLLAFAQALLESLLDVAGIQDAPIANQGFILMFMLLGLVLAVLLLTFAARYADHWAVRRYGPCLERDTI
ncbi:MAG: hypothetical protein R6W92_00335 [Desulfocurvibacter africanus]